jgi:CheY-like chemotaxis protein
MKLLVVDDIEMNRKVLRLPLTAKGHLILEAADGIEALEILERDKVDAVLSDILMPRMDGYRLCHEIRLNQQLRELPVILYSASYTSGSDEQLALTLGADKFIVKPAPLATILSALDEAIATHRATPPPEPWQEVEVLKEYSDRLVQKLEEKNTALTEANDRLAMLDRAKNDFLMVISHELRTPLNGLFGAGEIMITEMPATAQNKRLQGMFRQSARRILSVVEDAVTLTEIDVNGEHFKAATVSLDAALLHAVQCTTALAKSFHVALAMPPPNLGLVVGDERLLTRSLCALLETVVRFSTAGKCVGLLHEAGASYTRIIMDAYGRTISATAMPKFFNVFSVEEPLTPGGDLGLGPALASRILALFGGAVSVSNRESSGIRLTIDLKNAGGAAGGLEMVPPAPASNPERH